VRKGRKYTQVDWRVSCGRGGRERIELGREKKKVRGRRTSDPVV